METLIKLIEVVVWPLTILIILFWFRKQFASAFNRIKDFQASATGVSMSFNEKLEAAKELAKKVGIQGVSKSFQGINADGGTSRLKEVKGLEGAVKSYLLQLCSQSNIQVDNNDIKELNAMLKEKGVIQFGKFQLISSFLELTQAATDNITEEQLGDIKEISRIITQ